jgi:DNA polymerase-1
MSLLDIEMKLLPVLLKMRSFGCRVSVERLNSLESRMETELHRLNKEIDVMAKGVNYNSPMQVKEFLKHQGVEIPAVQKKDAYGEFVARESVAKDVLMQIDHPFAKKVLEIRVVDKLLNTFVRGAIKENLIGDRIHARFHPMVSDSYGAKTGRLSMSDPSLHQIPTRDAHWGKLIRGLFIPEEGCEWGKVDYSQIEPRLLAHDAVGASGEMVRTQYAEDPYKDYHQMTADLAGIDRKPAKTVNLGLTYGMGKEKLRREMMNLGHSAEDADALMSKYHEALPYIRETSDAMRKSAERLGYIKTILGRYRRFPDRSHARKAANARFQGSSADIMKKALVDLDATGLIDQGRIALTVHDEVDGSFPIGKREVIEEVQRVMETVVKLRVPLIAEPETGISWGEVKKIKESS